MDFVRGDFVQGGLSGGSMPGGFRPVTDPKIKCKDRWIACCFVE